MLLTIAAALLLTGFVGWVLGSLWGYTGVAIIGAVLILGVGAHVTIDGLQHQTGEVVTQIDNNTTATERVYESVDLMDTFPVGWLVMLLGAMLTIRTLNEEAL